MIQSCTCIVNSGPAPWWPCFLKDHNNLNNLGRGSHKEHLCQIISKSDQRFLTRRFFKYFPYIRLCKQSDPRDGAIFDSRDIIWTIFVEDHKVMLHAKYERPRPYGFWQEDFWSLLYSHIGKMGPAPWQPCFSPNRNNLNNLGRGSPKEHLCELFPNPASGFWQEDFLSIFPI